MFLPFSCKFFSPRTKLPLSFKDRRSSRVFEHVISLVFELSPRGWFFFAEQLPRPSSSKSKVQSKLSSDSILRPPWSKDACFIAANKRYEVRNKWQRASISPSLHFWRAFVRGWDSRHAKLRRNCITTATTTRNLSSSPLFTSTRKDVRLYSSPCEILLSLFFLLGQSTTLGLVPFNKINRDHEREFEASGLITIPQFEKFREFLWKFKERDWIIDWFCLVARINNDVLYYIPVKFCRLKLKLVE